MSSTDSAPIVTNNKEEHRYQVKIDDQIAVLTYKEEEGRIIFLHTGVPPALEGHGIANKLAFFALEEARTQHLTVIPSCPFVASYIRRHQEYLPLLTATEQTHLLQG